MTGNAATAPAGGLEAVLGAEAPIRLDIALACAPGEVLALVGPSGAGKSTALRCVAGLHRASRGAVRCGGADWFDAARGLDLPAHRRSAGLVFQDYALFPHMTALGNLVAAMGHRPRHDRAARARALLAMVHLSGLEDRRPAELSGGQQQRVAVARALARDPSVLLLDEPFSAVDRTTRRRLQSELAALRRTLSIPIILVTHDLDEALALADRMCLMHHGRGIQTAAPGEMMARPASAEVAQLLDLRNLFRATVERHDAAAGTTWLRWAGRMLEAAHAPGLAQGEGVDWLVRSSAVVLHDQRHPVPGEQGNPVPGRVLDMLAMGGEVRVTLDIGDPDGGTLSFPLPLHAAHLSGLAPGGVCTVSLLRDGIHAMKRAAP